MTKTDMIRPSNEKYTNQVSAAVIEGLIQYSGINLDKDDFRLYDVIDPDALDSLFYHQQDSDLFVEFNVRDATVSIWRSDGEIQIDISNHRE